MSAFNVIASDVDGKHDSQLMAKHKLDPKLGFGFHNDETFVFPTHQLGKVVPEARLQRSCASFIKMSRDNPELSFFITRGVLDICPEFMFNGVNKNVTFEKPKAASKPEVVSTEDEEKTNMEPKTSKGTK